METEGKTKCVMMSPEVALVYRWKQRSVAIAIVVLALTSGGCGLIAVPMRTTVPARPLRKVVVKDAVTGTTLDNARVGFFLRRYHGWGKPVPEIVVWKSDKHDLDSFSSELASGTGRMARHENQGTYEIAPVSRWGHYRLWFPISLSLGWGCRDIADGFLLVHAPQHKSIRISNAVAVIDNMHAMRGRAKELPWRYVQLERDKITVFLPPAEATSAAR